MLGGRTNHWGRVSLRMGPFDFKPKSFDGLGFDWPISYEDVAPLLRQGRAGRRDFWLEGRSGEQSRQRLLPAAAETARLRASAHARREEARRAGHPFAHGHPHQAAQRPRVACFYATSCGRGCAIRANFQSTTVLLPPAMDSGNLDVLTGAMAREVTLDAQGRATGVQFPHRHRDRKGRARRRQRVVILGGQRLREPRACFLTAAPAKFPQGPW